MKINTLGHWNTLSHRNTLGDGNTLGDFFRHGERLTLAGVKVRKLLCMSNIYSTGRQVKVIVHTEGVLIEAGCFKGTVDKFCTKATSEGKHMYAAVVRATADAFEAEVNRQGITGGW